MIDDPHAEGNRIKSAARIKLNNLAPKIAEADNVDSRLQQEPDILTRSTIGSTSPPLRSLLNKLPLELRRTLFSSIQPVYQLFRYRLLGAMRSLGYRQSKSTSKFHVDEIALHYDGWIRQFDTLSAIERTQIRCHIAGFETKPLISIIMPTYETSASFLRDAIESVRRQLYPHWELCIADDASRGPHIKKIISKYTRIDPRIKCTFRQSNGHVAEASNTALDLVSGEYVALLDHDDVLSEHALYLVAEAIQRHPAADVFYSDEDKLDADGKRCDPHFKPDWNPELFFGQNYLNHLTVYKRSIVEKSGRFRVGYEGSQDYDLALRVIALTKGPIVHIPHVLYHWRIFPGAATMSSTHLATAVNSARRALVAHFSRLESNVTVEEVLGAFHRVVRPDPLKWPRISVIIPTRDHLDVLKDVVDGLRTKTDYPDLEILIADNDSSEPATVDFFRAIQAEGVSRDRMQG